MNKKNTAVICLSPYFGGMETDSSKLAQKLMPYVDITFIAKKNSELSKSVEALNKLPLETVSFSKSFSLSIIFGVREILKRRNIQNVIFFGATELKSLYFAFLGLNINVLVRHGTTKKSSKKDPFHQLIYSCVNHHIVISQHLLKNVKQIIPYKNKEQLKLIYPSINCAHQSPDLKNEKLKILHVGRIIPGKGQLDAIKACDILTKNNIDFEFNLVGELDNNYKEEFLSQYHKLPYKNKINMVGFTNDVESYLSKADLFIFPSDFEGFGNAFMEAIGYGLYCISYTNTTFIEFNQLGLFFGMAKNKDLNDLRKKLIDYLERDVDKTLIKLSKNKDIIKMKFSSQNEINQYLDLMQ